MLKVTPRDDNFCDKFENKNKAKYLFIHYRNDTFLGNSQISLFIFLALVNAYVQQNEEEYGKCIDAAHRYEAVIEGKHVTHQILDSDGKVR